jgi:hypothetical protein
MKKMYKVFEVYKFDELNQAGQDKAISDFIDFMLECTREEDASENFKKAVRHAERLHTPWFTGSYVLDYCRDEILETMRLNDYDFLYDGSFIKKTGMLPLPNSMELTPA